MNATSIITDPAAISEQVTDPYKDLGGAIHCQEVWRAHRFLPPEQQAITRDSEEYKILTIGCSEENLDEYSGDQLGRLFTGYCLPGFYLHTPAPSWATDMFQSNTSGEAHCVHSLDLPIGASRLLGSIERFDTFDVNSGEIEIGETRLNISWDELSPAPTAEEAETICKDLMAAAERLRQVKAGEGK